MALRQLNTYSLVGHTDVDAMFETLDKTFKGLCKLSLTEFNTSVRPQIAAGSTVECNGALFIADIAEDIAENPPDGVVYVRMIPSGSPISLTAEFTEVSPVWDDEKQGWYSPTSGEENYVYVAGCYKVGATFPGKGYFDNHTRVGHVDDILASVVRFPYIIGYGQAVSRIDFAVLFAAIGTVGGVGDGYSTFNIPDTRGRDLIGLDNMGGTSANRVTNAQADILGGAAGSEIGSTPMGAYSSGLWPMYRNVMNPYMAGYKAIKFI